MRFLLLILAPALALAQDPRAPNSTPLAVEEIPVTKPISSTVPVSEALRLKYLKAQIAEAAFLNNPTLENRSDVVDSFEQLINLSCFPKLHRELEYKGLPTDPECLMYIESVEKYDSQNPAAICARQGIDASACKSAYTRQTSGELQLGDESSQFNAPGVGSVDVAAKLHLAKNEEEIRKLDEEFRNQLMRFQYEKERRAEAEAIQSMLRLLKLSCHDAKLKLIKDESVLATPTPYVPAGQNSESLLFAANTPTPDNKLALLNETFIRERQLPKLCRFYIEQALALRENLSAAICFRDGLYSPNCIISRRHEKVRPLPSLPKPENIATPKPTTPGFVAF
jgi:hypothetical protein